mgnify:CR=1 FL=1
MKKKLIIGLLLFSLLTPLAAVRAQPKQITPQNLIDDVVNQLKLIKDFKGTVVTKVYLQEQVLNSRTQIMKSETRSMTRNHGDTRIPTGENSLLLNTIPWIYLPPDYETIKSSLPLAAQTDYNNPLTIIDQLYDMKLLGEGTHQERDVYIVELQNVFSTQRIFIDQEYLTIRKVDIFNGSNIKVATINYDNFELFAEQVWMPTKIIVADSIGQKVLEINYQSWNVNLGLTNFDFLQGFETDYQTKINRLQEKIAKSNNKVELYLQLSELYQKNDDVQKAISTLQQAISREDKIDYRKKLAKIYQQQGEFRKSLGEIRAALQLNYDDAELHYLLGELQLQLGNTDQARNYLERAISYDSQNEKYLEKLFWVYNNLANKNNDLYMLERAEKTIKKLIDLKPKNEDYRIYLGDIYLKSGKTIKAADAYQKAVNLAPKDTWTYIKLANYYQEIKSYEKAEELYRYVIYLEDSLENHKRLADLYFEQKKYELALEEYKTISNRAANDLDVKLRLAETYVAVGETDKALKIFNKILKEKEAEELYTRITDIVKKYQPQRAIEILHKLLQEENLFTVKQKDKLYKELGTMYFEKIKQEQEKTIQELLPLKSQAEIYNLMGEIEFSNGNLEEAINYFQKSVAEISQIDNHYNLAVSYLLMDNFVLARQEAETMKKLGARAKGDQLIELSYNLKSWQSKYNQQYAAGRINLIEGDRLRQSGKLDEAKIEYQASVSENYAYQPPYFYLSVFYSVTDQDANLELAKTGVKDETIQLLEELITTINQVKA